MIGMMYLVLTAMLAMNVSAEVLNAFKIFEVGLSQTAKVFDNRNDDLERAFNVAYSENKERVGPRLTEAMEVRKLTREFIAYVDELKIALVKEADGDNAPSIEQGAINSELIKNLSSTEPSSRLMVRLQKGLELKNRIEDYKRKMLSMVKDPSVEDNIKKTMATNDIMSSHGDGMKPWEVGTFTDLPLIAAVPLLTKIQVDALTIEADMMNYLLKLADVGTVKIDRFDAVVQSESDYVIRGGEFQARIFLAASDRTLQPSITVNGQSLRTVDGGAIYRAAANTIGEQFLRGTITLNGKPYSFNYKYTVAEPNVVVSPSKMNVLYRGVDNPIDVSAAGIPDNKVHISVSNGTLRRVGAQYMVIPSDGNSCDISVVAEINGTKTNMGKKNFPHKKCADSHARNGRNTRQNGNSFAVERIAGYQSSYAAGF